MAWADAAFYENEYMMGRAPLIPLAEFAYWEARAAESINFKRVKIEEPPACLKNCVCEVATILYEADSSPKPGEVVSESNSSYSWKAQEARPVDAVKRDIRDAVIKHLAGSELHDDFVFRAV